MQHSKARRAPLALALAALFSTTAATAATTGNEVVPSVLVTGSRISRVQAEGPSGVTVLKAEDIDKLGYKNVADALQALTENTGFTQGEDFGNTFTPAANAISLRGLGPNHTLTLINGRRIADYPTAYEGSVNFVNLANIPSALIERIEILSGGASAIYGSDAIAGVVNIILKKQTDGMRLNLKAGGTERGGGENARAQLSGGFAFGDLSGVYGIELSGRQPIWSRQREFMADTTLSGAAPAVVFGRRDVQAGRYVAPPAGACETAAGLFDGSLQRFASRTGEYCGSGRASPTYWTTQTGNRSANLAGLATYALNPTTELFGEVLLGWTSTENNTRGPSWTSGAATTGYFRNATTGRLETWSRRFAPEELGGVETFNREWRDTWSNFAIGARGELGGSWSFDAAFNRSDYLNRTRTPRLLARVDEFLLGPRLSVDAQGVGTYAPDPARLFRPLTPSEIASISGESHGRNTAWTDNANVVVNGELFDLPGGRLRTALLAEAGRQGFVNTADARLGQGIFYNTRETPEVRGERSRYAVGAEFNAPLLKTLTATLAARHDDCRFAGRHDGRFTYNAGLEFRPVREVLVRGHHATSFRAPDMTYVFTAESRGYYSSSTDYWRCAQAGQPLETCEFVDLSPGFNFVKTGSRDLKSEQGKSSGLGIVWAPRRDIDISFDWWRISISDLVTDLSSDKILRDEADCRTGVKDATSPTCVDAIRRVRRNPPDAVLRPGEVIDIAVNPINAARQSTEGFDIGGKYGWATEALGRFDLGLKFTKVRRYVYQQYAGDPAGNLVGTPEHSDWPDRLNATLGWQLGDWSATLAGQRNGRIATEDRKAWLGPWWNFNASARVQLSKASSLSVIVNNLFDTVRRDPTASWPYYPVGYYLPHGRQAWIEFEHRFGS